MIKAFEIANQTQREDDHGKPLTHTAESLVKAADLIYKNIIEE